MTRDDLILGRYEPLGTAGEGGFGTVQVAWDPRIQRKVAIKTIRLTASDAARAALPGAEAVSRDDTHERWHGVQPWDEYLGGEPEELPYPADPEFINRDQDEDEAPGSSEQVTYLAHMPGLDEARTAAMLMDPRIVTVYDFEVRERTAYLIMEYVEGITLTRLLADYADYITLDMIAAVFDSVAGALEVAHDAGVLHLDIKPDNILVSVQGQVKVTDFGLATLADASGGGRAGGGTVGYMPPEQIRREQLDARSDEWALASITYEMLTGSNPFRVEGLDGALQAIEQAELVLPSLCWNDVDDQIDDVVFYALDPDREERYQSISDFAEEVDKFLGDADRGAAQLQLVVEDALKADERLETEDEPAGENVESGSGAEDRPGFFKRLAGMFGFGANDGREPKRTAEQQPALPAGPEIEDRRSLTERFMDLFPSDEDAAQGADYDPGYRQGIEQTEEAAASETQKLPREPVAARVPSAAMTVASHVFGALASGFIAGLAASNMHPLLAAFGPGASYVVIAIAVVAAVAGVIRSHIGALVSLCLLGIAFVMCGHPIVGAVLLILTVAWWYTIGHEGAASANVVLAMPVLGAIGGASAVPFLAGRSLRPVRAILTLLFAFVIAVALGSLGTMSLLDWGVFSHWDFGRGDITSAIRHMLTQSATWATLGGWVVATLVLSLCHLRESKPLAVIGAALALVAVLVGNLVFAPPTPQLIVSAIVAMTVLLAIEL